MCGGWGPLAHACSGCQEQLLLTHGLEFDAFNVSKSPGCVRSCVRTLFGYRLNPRFAANAVPSEQIVAVATAESYVMLEQERKVGKRSMGSKRGSLPFLLGPECGQTSVVRALSNGGEIELGSTLHIFLILPQTLSVESLMHAHSYSEEVALRGALFLLICSIPVIIPDGVSETRDMMIKYGIYNSHRAATKLTWLMKST